MTSQNMTLTLSEPGMIYSYFEIGLKNSSFRLPYQHHSSSADCTRELFKPSKDSASLSRLEIKFFGWRLRNFCEWHHKWICF